MRIATEPLAAITIVMDEEKINYGVVGNPPPLKVMEALDKARDAILAQYVRDQNQENPVIEEETDEALDVDDLEDDVQEVAGLA